MTPNHWNLEMLLYLALPIGLSLPVRLIEAEDLKIRGGEYGTLGGPHVITRVLESEEPFLALDKEGVPTEE